MVVWDDTEEPAMGGSVGGEGGGGRAGRCGISAWKEEN